MADQCISLQRWPGNQAIREFEEKLRTPSEHKEKMLKFKIASTRRV